MSNINEAANTDLKITIEVYEKVLRETFDSKDIDKALGVDSSQAMEMEKNPEDNIEDSNLQAEDESDQGSQNSTNSPWLKFFPWVRSTPESQPLTLKQILPVLHARDAIQAALEKSSVESSQDSEILICLDKFLKDNAKAIAQNNDFVQARESLSRSETSWWWFLEATPPDPLWSRQDWLWNALSIVAIGFAATNIIFTSKAFSNSKSGFDWLGAFTVVTQGTVVAAFAGGAFTEKGQKISEDVLNSLNIPKNLHAESTFIISASFCGLTYLLAQELPLVGAYYYQKGQLYEESSNWNSAQDQYDRALDFLPNKAEAYIALGNTYEYLSDLDKAEEAYKNAFAEGNSESATRRARLLALRAFDNAKWQKPLDNEVLQEEKKGNDAEMQKKEIEPKTKEKEENKAKIREAENILHIAQARISQETNQKKRRSQSQENLFTPDKINQTNQDLTVHSRKQATDIYIIFGIIEWAQVNLEETDDDKNSNHLRFARENFQMAQAETEYLPPLTEEQGLAECYQNLALLAEEKFDLYREQTAEAKADPQMPSLMPAWSKAIDDFIKDTENRGLAEYLGLTQAEIKSAKNEDRLKQLIAQKDYNYQFGHYYNAVQCYQTLDSNAEMSVLDSSIMLTILNVIW